MPTLPILYLGYHIPAADPENPDTAALAPSRRPSSARRARSTGHSSSRAEGRPSWPRPRPKRDPGLFTIVARVRNPEDLAEVRKRIEDALAEAAGADRPARLAAIKDHLRYAFAGSLDSADAVAHAVGESIATTGRPDAMNDLYAAYERLTPADLQRVAGRYFAPTNETVVTLESKKEA